VSSKRLRVARRAERQLRAAADWWLANRPFAPDALKAELAASFAQLLENPLVGRVVRVTVTGPVRRISLNTTHYYLYYRVTPAEITVLGFWHQSRKGEPPGVAPH